MVNQSICYSSSKAVVNYACNFILSFTLALDINKQVKLNFQGLISNH